MIFLMFINSGQILVLARFKLEQLKLEQQLQMIEAEKNEIFINSEKNILEDKVMQLDLKMSNTRIETKGNPHYFHITDQFAVVQK